MKPESIWGIYNFSLLNRRGCITSCKYLFLKSRKSAPKGMGT